ncbi:MAG: hypothetical protein KGZ97_00165 [Bacteroidetes bacterium]|nr:hypothetical protein [Bacteroidota bacterium]
MNRKNNIEDLFLKEFKDFSPEPPDHIWESIFNRLEEESPRRNKIPVWMKIAASVAALLIPTLMLFWLVPKQSSQVAELNNEKIILVEENGTDLNSSSIELGITETTNTELPAYRPNETIASNNNEVLFDNQNETITKIENDIIPVISLNVSPDIQTDVTLAEITTLSDIPALSTNNSIQNIADLVTSQKQRTLYTSSIGASISPHYSNNYYLGSMQSSGIPFENLEENLKTFSFSLKYSIEGKSRLSLETGISYFTIGQLVKEILSFGVKEETANNQIIDQIPYQSALTSLGEVSFTNSSIFFADIISYRIATEKDSPFDEPVLLEQFDDKISQYLSFIDVPLIVKYRLFDYNNADISLRMGVSGSYLLQNNVYLGEGDYGQVIGNTIGIKDFSMAGIGGLSVNIPLTNKLKFMLEPTARIFITPVSHSNFSGDTHPVSLFVNTGLKYSF